MPIDPSIALSLKPMQITSQEDYLKDIYAQQNAQQTNQLNRMKMDEYSRGIAEQDQFKNALAQAQNEDAIKKAFYAKGDVKGYSDYMKAQQEASNLKLTGQETTGKINKAKQEFTNQALRNISANPSDENIIAWGQDAVLKGISTEAEVKQTVDHLLAVPATQRSAYLASQGASAADLKPHIQMQNLGGTSQIVAVPAYGGALTTLSTDQMTATPGELLTEATSRRGQDITATTSRRGQDLTNARDLERIAIEKGKNSPEYIAMKAKQEEKGKEQGKFETTAPAAIKTTEDAIKNIDAMVGKPATVDAKTGKVIPGTAAHEGFKAAVGTSSIFPTIPGSKAADFEARYNQLKGTAFLDAYDTLRGGGSITEVEGTKAENAKMRMSLAQSEKEFIDAARDFQDVLRAGIKRAKERLSSGASGTTPAGATVSNW